MITAKIYLKLCLIFFVSTLCFAEGVSPELTQKDYEYLLKNRLIIRYNDVKESAWPEVTIFKLIKATPIECAAVFSYYPDQTNYSPDLLESRPVKYITPADVHVYFKFNMPWPVCNTVTVMGNRLSRLVNNVYQIEWYFVESDSSYNNYGKAQFFPYKNYALYRYQSYIKPKSSMAKLFKKQMINNLKKSCLAFESYIMMLKDNKLRLMKKYLTTMENVFRGEFVFSIKNQ